MEKCWVFLNGDYGADASCRSRLRSFANYIFVFSPDNQTFSINPFQPLALNRFSNR